ncbi:MAG: hypothetical protein GY810_29780 [Aureispira sp.]|nr:hypothetical protein [Aureispira sp.]
MLKKMIVFAALLLLVGAELTAQKGYCEGYVLPTKKNTSEIHLDRIRFKEDTTIVFMHYIAPGDYWNVKVEHPNSSYPVVIKTHDKEYRMIGAKNIAYAPNVSEVKKGIPYHFQLYFQAVPLSVTKFDIIEHGVNEYNSFNFYDVKITRCLDQQKSIRFIQKMDFDTYFLENNSKEDTYEGYWLVSKKVAEVQGNEQLKFMEEGRVDTVAVVREDGMYRAYFLDGVTYGTEFNEQKKNLWAAQDFLDDKFKIKALHKRNIISYRKTFSKKWLKATGKKEWQNKKIMLLVTWRKVY